MKGMSEREYAAHSGLSRGGVQKARKNGRLVVHDDGSINAAASDVRRAEMTDPDQQRRSLGSESLPSGPGDTTSYIKARTALTVYAAQERQLAVQKKKGTLVDRARAETLVFRLARQERDVWVTWPGRVAALMAAQIMAEGEPLLTRTRRCRRAPSSSGCSATTPCCATKRGRVGRGGKQTRGGAALQLQ